MAELFRKRPEDKPATTIDDIVNKNAVARLRRDPPGGQAAAKGKDKIDDSDLIASMAKRLSLLEKDLRCKVKELERVQGENEALRSKLHVAEDEIAARASSSAAAGPHASPRGHSGGDELTHLRSENSRLRAQANQAWKQVADLKSFLNDYGMVWVGPEERRRSSAGGQPPAAGQDAHSGAGPSHGGVGGGVSGVAVPRRVSETGAAGPLPPRPPAGEKDGQAAAAPLRSDIRRRSYTGNAAPAGNAQGSDAHAAGARGGSGGGPSSSSGPDAAHHANPSSPSGSSHPDGAAAGPPFRMADLLARVEELNQMAGDGCGQLVARGGMGGGGGPQAHVLHTPEPVRLTVFRDGIQLHRNAARPFRDPGVESVLADILDGYFPAPLKADFPDGVPIKVIDRSRDSYKDALSPVNHPAMRGGAGGGSNVRSFHDLESGEGAPMSRDNFLSKLPQAIIKNGKVIDVRGGVGKVMGASDAPSSSSSAAGGSGAQDNANISVVHTPTDALLTTSQRNHRGPVLPPPSREGGSGRPALPPQGNGAAAGAGGGAVAGPGHAKPGVAAAGEAAPAAPSGPSITTLQVKSEDGQQTLIIKLQYDDTIGALRKYINAHRAQNKDKDANRSTDYELRTAFPPRKYDQLNETLRDAGLVPNATLFLRTPAP